MSTTTTTAIFGGHCFPVTRWHIPKLMSTTPVDYFLIIFISFGIGHHRFKMVEGRGDEPCASGIHNVH